MCLVVNPFGYYLSTGKFTIEKVEPFAWNHDPLRPTVKNSEEELKNRVKRITKCSQCGTGIFIFPPSEWLPVCRSTLLRATVVGSEWLFMPRIPRKSLKKIVGKFYKRTSRVKVIHYFFYNFFQFLCIV